MAVDRSLLDRIKEALSNYYIAQGWIWKTGSEETGPIALSLNEFIEDPAIAELTMEIAKSLGLDPENPNLDSASRTALRQWIELTFMPLVWDWINKTALSLPLDQTLRLTDLKDEDLQEKLEESISEAIRRLPQSLKAKIEVKTEEVKPKEEEGFTIYKEIAKAIPRDEQSLFISRAALEEVMGELERYLAKLRRLGFGLYSLPQVYATSLKGTLAYVIPEFLFGFFKSKGSSDPEARVLANMFASGVQGYVNSKLEHALHSGALPTTAAAMNWIVEGLNYMLRDAGLPTVRVKDIEREIQAELGRPLDELIPENRKWPEKKQMLKEAVAMSWFGMKYLPDLLRRPVYSPGMPQEYHRFRDLMWQNDMWQLFGPIFLAFIQTPNEAKRLFRELLKKTKPGENFLDVVIREGMGPRDWLHIMQTLKHKVHPLEWAPSTKWQMWLQEHDLVSESPEVSQTSGTPEEAEEGEERASEPTTEKASQ